MNEPYIWLVFAPLLGFLVTGFLGKFLGDRLSQIITCSLMGVSFVSAIYVLKTIALGAETKLIDIMTWMQVDDFHITWSFYYDSLSAVMCFVVTSVSFLVHVYSIGYMADDPSIPRFMGYLSLFTFMMLMLVTANNMIQTFFGWEGVGLASYLLIGFWYQKDSANAAAMKAFIVNRVGDVGLALGIACIFYTFHTLDYADFLPRVHEAADFAFRFKGHEFSTLEVAAFLLFIGAMGKSAQIGLHTWLPDAMEGPTPVSALIHAATMVTAGVFLVARLSPLYDVTPYASTFIVIIGATTAFFAGTIALTQNDIKRVIAYSTCSQLGYMFFAAGLGAYSISIFHLFTHAFFKALLFLGAGSVIHAMSDEQDMQKMGGIWRQIPVTYAMMWIGSLALAGVPFFAGYYSKDAILEIAWLAPGLDGHYAYLLGIGAAFLTALYSGRLLWLTFGGQSRADEKVMSHVHEPGLSMLIPLFALAVGAIFSGYLGVAYVESSDFWKNAIVLKEISSDGHLPLLVHYLPVITGLLGLSLAYVFYGKPSNLPSQIAHRFRALYEFFYNKWYVDELYQSCFVSPAQKLGSYFWMKGDGQVIDGYGPNGVADFVMRISKRTSQLQTGYVYHYALAFVLGFVGLLIWLNWG